MSFFVKKRWFLKSYSRTDLKISFCDKFCFKSTFPQVCTTKSHDKDYFYGCQGGGSDLITAGSNYSDAPWPVGVIRLFRHGDFETLSGRLPVKLGSDRRETLPKRVSNNFRRLIFRRGKIFVRRTFRTGIFFLLIWCGFGRATAKRTSKAASASNFA